MATFFTARHHILTLIYLLLFINSFPTPCLSRLAFLLFTLEGMHEWFKEDKAEAFSGRRSEPTDRVEAGITHVALYDTYLAHLFVQVRSAVKTTENDLTFFKLFLEESPVIYNTYWTWIEWWREALTSSENCEKKVWFVFKINRDHCQVSVSDLAVILTVSMNTWLHYENILIFTVRAISSVSISCIAALRHWTRTMEAGLTALQSKHVSCAVFTTGPSSPLLVTME